jgi:hypothetical protein
MNVKIDYSTVVLGYNHFFGNGKQLFVLTVIRYNRESLKHKFSFGAKNTTLLSMM